MGIKGAHNLQNKEIMKKEEILIWALNNRCKYESSKEMDFDTHLAIMDAMEAYTYEQTEKYRELIEWLSDECPTVCPPLEPYTTADLSHDFAEILRTKLDDLK